MGVYFLCGKSGSFCLSLLCSVVSLTLTFCPSPIPATKNKVGQIEKVFGVASHQKVWDHFTKAQRKNIDTWRKQSQVGALTIGRFVGGLSDRVVVAVCLLCQGEVLSVLVTEVG